MYLSCLPDLMPLASRITVECEPRLIPLVRRSFGVEAFGSEEETPDLGYDCQIPLGTLPKFFRRTPESFPGKPYLKPDPEKVAKFRDRLHRLGPRPWIGLGWYGGVKATRPHERSLPLWKLLPVMAGRTCVSVQYGNTSIREAEEVDLPILDESLGLDLDAQAALIAACDIIVTVPQTAVHVAGALGVPTLVLTPVRCSWRYGYGLSGQNEVMPWYGSVRLLRQPAKDAWEAVVDRAAEAIEGVEREMLRRAA
jgi:ADP-heptose:LPS heptosyltransferase